MARFERESSESTEKLVALNRVSKTVRGGRIFRSAALMVVGGGKGRIGFSSDGATEVFRAVRKGIEDAKKNICTVTLSGTTIPHKVIGELGTGHVLLKPVVSDADTIAGGPIRAVIEAVGIRDIRVKCLRSNNLQNVVFVTLEGLKSLRGPEEVVRIRGKNASEIVGQGGP